MPLRGVTSPGTVADDAIQLVDVLAWKTACLQEGRGEDYPALFTGGVGKDSVASSMGGIGSN